MIEKLKPCPFCGARGDDLAFLKEAGMSYINCTQCGSAGPIIYPDGERTLENLAGEAWNLRSKP